MARSHAEFALTLRHFAPTSRHFATSSRFGTTRVVPMRATKVVQVSALHKPFIY